MLKILQGRLQQCMNRELPDYKLGLEKAEEPETNVWWIIAKAREFQEKHLLLLYSLCKSL